jgi:hypothetical protein
MIGLRVRARFLVVSTRHYPSPLPLQQQQPRCSSSKKSSKKKNLHYIQDCTDHLATTSVMAEVENHFTVFVRLPFNRGNFVDPPPVAWSAAKERALWDVISKQSRGNEINWITLAEQFEVTQPFLLQQAAWLYERQLSQVRAQMRKVGNRQSATPSPAPSSVAGSTIGGQAMKRGGSGGSVVPKRLSIQPKDSPTILSEGSAPSTPAKRRTSLSFRTTSAVIGSQLRSGLNTSRPISRQTSKESVPPDQTPSRRGSTQYQLSRSPVQAKLPSAESSDSEQDMTKSRMAARRPNPSFVSRRVIRHRRSHEAQDASAADDEDADDDDDDVPAFVPLSPDTESRVSSTHQQDPSATLRGGFARTHPTQRPGAHRRTTSERVVPGSTQAQQQAPLHSSASSASSGLQPSASAETQQSEAISEQHVPRARHQGPLSPRQQAALAAAGLPSRNRGSDTSPSMGSSFSDLDDTSVTQSALEEALLSNMGNNGGMGSRVSGISQALRSRYFDAQSGAGR